MNAYIWMSTVWLSAGKGKGKVYTGIDNEDPEGE